MAGRVSVVSLAQDTHQYKASLALHSVGIDSRAELAICRMLVFSIFLTHLSCWCLTSVSARGLGLPLYAFAKPDGRDELLFGESRSSQTSNLEVQALGSANEAYIKENRQFRHSDLQPSGRFARKGQTIEVNVPEGVEGLQLSIVLYGNYSSSWPDQPANQFRVDHALRPGINRFVASINGFVHLVDSAKEGSRSTVVQVTGGEAVPIFTLGQSDQAAFRREVEQTGVHSGVLVGRRVMIEIRATTLRAWLSREATDVPARIRLLDEVIDESDRVYGLSRNRTASDGAYKSPHKVHVVNPDTGVGMASATQDRITFQNDTGAMEYILTRQVMAMWAFWHEVGHTYQPIGLIWSGMSEVTVNIASLSNEERVLNRLQNSLDGADRQRTIKEFLARPDATRKFEDGDVWVKLMMFDQLRRAFGVDFYARMAQDFRVNRALGVVTPSTAAASKDTFALTAAKIANRNLNPWLQAWGFAVSAGVVAEVAKYQNTSFNIVENLIRSTDKIEHVVAYRLPTGSVQANGVARYGQRTVENGGVNFTIAPGDDSVVGQQSVRASSIGSGGGTGIVEFLSPDRTEHNVVYTTFDVRRGTMIEVKGISDHVVASLALMEDGLILVTGADRVAHGNFDTTYFAARLVNGSSGGPVDSSASITGKEKGKDFVARFDRTTFHDRQFLVLEHPEPRNRLRVWSEDRQFLASASIIQVFQIQGMKLVRSVVAEAHGWTDL